MENEELIAEIRRLKAENAEFAGFFYKTLHDLKSPMRAISNLAQWIEEDQATPEKPESRDHLILLRQRAAAMTALLNGLVERFRSGQGGG